jgi:ABC-type oligopeptide transport system ATPase subunit
MLLPLTSFFVWPFSFSPRTTDLSSPPKLISSSQELIVSLTSEGSSLARCLDRKEEVRAFLGALQDNPKELDAFLKTFMEWGIQEDSQQTMVFLADVLSLDALVKMVKAKDKLGNFQDAVKWAVDRKDLYSLNSQHALQQQVYSEWRRARSLIIHFVPNLINIFLGTFSLLDVHKNYTSAWDKYILIGIIYKFLVIPYALTKALEPFLVTPAKTYAVTAFILVSIGAFFACYQRFVKPLPDEILNCVNLTKKCEQGLIEAKVRMPNLDELLSALLAGHHVVLVGKSGAGKTALVHQLVQLHQQGQLPEELSKKINYELDGGMLTANTGLNPAPAHIGRTCDQIKGCEEYIQIFIDEFFSLAQDNKLLTNIKKRLLENKPGPQVIMAVTVQEYQQIIEEDKKSGSTYRRRVKPIYIDSESDEQVELILDALEQKAQESVPIASGAISKVLELSKAEEFLPGVGRPAKAKHIFEAAVGLCKGAYNPHYVSEKLNQALQKREILKIHARKVQSGENLKAYHAECENITTQETMLATHKQQAQKIKKLVVQHNQSKSHLGRLTHTLANHEQAQLDEETQKLYLLYEFYGINAMKTILEREIAEVRPHLAVQVDEALVQRAYDEAVAFGKQVK